MEIEISDCAAKYKSKINFKFNPEEQKNFVTKTHTEMEISTESLPLYQMTKWKSVRKNTMTSNKTGIKKEKRTRRRKKTGWKRTQEDKTKEEDWMEEDTRRKDGGGGLDGRGQGY
ncbi:hypothetical protein Zmor_002093 [Zophobas morio]|uniref:Uncharacterized protein n=1 Tax=Zophobas morio TaxID=2755281 RepID=A0AA38J038_9CUCU|nr:hypothetical protein Zmor_002093 [Zophobas morio]